MPLYLAFFFAFCAYGSLGTGNVLMKKGIGWIGWKGPKNRDFFFSLLIWSLGFIIMNASGIFTALAVKRLTPEEASIFAGLGILIMIFLAKLMLGEPLYSSDTIGAILIVCSISLLGLFPHQKNIEIWSNPNGFILSAILLIPFFFLIMGLISKTRAVFFFALCSGQSSGILVILLKILVARHEYQISVYFSSVFLYLYVVFAILALISLQMALKRGQLMIVGPLQYSSLILYPAVSSQVLGIPLHFGQWPLFIGCAAGIWIIMRKR